MGEFDSWYVHSVSVQTFRGTGGRGDIFDAAQDVPGQIDDSVKLTIDSGGEQKVIESVFYTSATKADLFTVGSRVTTSHGSKCRVLKVSTTDINDNDLDGLVVYLG